MSHSRSLFAWLSLFVACVAWAGVGFAFWYVGSLEETYVAEKAERADAESRGASATRIQSLIEQTAVERSRLDERLSKGLIATVETIEAVGVASGIQVRVDDISEVNPPEEGARTALRTARVLASARGSFDDVMHTALLLESLPMPLTIEEMSFEHTPGEAGGIWSVLVRMQIMTSATLES